MALFYMMHMHALIKNVKENFMDYDVVFELTEISKIHYFGAAGTFIGLFIIAFSIFLSSFGTAVHPTYWHTAIAAVFSVVFLYFAIQITVGTTQMLHEIYGTYEKGNAQIVEGSVEHCDTPYFYKHGRGTFEVGGIKFDYNHATGVPGYGGKGNLIHSDGQQVRIHYITYSNRNIIVKIELVKP